MRNILQNQSFSIIQCMEVTKQNTRLLAPRDFKESIPYIVCIYIHQWRLTTTTGTSYSPTRERTLCYLVLDYTIVTLTILNIMDCNPENRCITFLWELIKISLTCLSLMENMCMYVKWKQSLYVNDVKWRPCYKQQGSKLQQCP